MPGPSSTDLTTPRPRPLVDWRLAAVALGLWIGGFGPLASAQTPRPRQDSNQAGFGVAPPPPGFVDRTRPSLPEGLAMVVEIVAGGQLTPGRGWYEKGVSQTRFDWDSVAARLDRDHDGSIVRDEFPGPAGDYRGLDRDRSGKVTREDFQFPVNALYRSRSRMLLSFGDRNGDGKITAEEFHPMIFMATRDDYTRIRFFSDAIDDVQAAFKESEKRGIPFLSLADFRATVDLAAEKNPIERISNPDGDVEVASRPTLLRALVRREIGSLHTGPGLGEPAPDFTLPTEDGRGQVALSKLLGSKPVVLVFGSLTDGVFRSDAGSLEKLYRIYRDRAEFLMVYVRESRPSDGWESPLNKRAKINVPQPTDQRVRLQLARDLRKKLGLGWPMVVDTMDDRVGILYSGLPDRIYLLDPRGKVAYKSGRGPFGFKPEEVEQSLILLLQADSAPASKPAAPAGR